MKKIIQLTSFALVAVFGASCTTSYDQYGNRSQAVDPAAAVVGAAAVGAVAYSVGKDRGKRKSKNHYYHNNNYYGNRPNYGYHRR